MRSFAHSSFPKVLPLVCYAVIAAPSAFASDSALDEVVVTASRSEQPLAQTHAHTSVINAQAIRESLARDLPSLLAGQAGIQVNRNGGFGASGGLFMRGASSSQVLVLVDGVPLTKQDASGGVSLEHVALDNIDRIEVVRGNVSAIYGSGAIGGVIQIFTRPVTKGVSVNAGLEVGNRGSAKAYANVGGAYQSLGYYLGVSANSTKGFSAINTQQIAAANPDKDGYANQSVNGQLTYRFNDAHRVGAKLWVNDGRFDFDSAFGAPNDGHFGRTNLRQWSLDSQHQLTKEWKVSLLAADHREQNRNSYGGAFASDDRYTTRTRSMQWNNQFKYSPQAMANIGVEKQWQSIDTDDGFGGLYAVPRQTLAVFGGTNWQGQSLSLQANVRHDRAEQINAAQTNITQTKTTGLLGVGWQLTPSLRASALLSSAYNLAPLGYLYAPFFGNANLRPETATSTELGLQYQTKAALLNARFFSTRLRDQFEYDFLTNTFSNLSATSNKGFELSANGKLDSLKGFAWKSALTLQDPRDRTTDQTLNRRAKVLANFGVSQRWLNVQVAADMLFTGKRDDAVAPPPSGLGAYAITNARVSYWLQPKVELVFGVRNLFDRQYQTAYGFNSERRSVLLGIRLAGGSGG